MKLRLISTEPLVDHLTALVQNTVHSQRARRYHAPGLLFDFDRSKPFNIEAFAQDVVIALIDDRLQRAMLWTPKGHDNAFLDKAIRAHLPNWVDTQDTTSGSALLFDEVIDVVDTIYMPTNLRLFGFTSTWRQCSMIPVGSDLGFVVGEDYRITDWMARFGADYGAAPTDESEDINTQIQESHGDEIHANTVRELFAQLAQYLGPERLQLELEQVGAGQKTMQMLLDEMRTWQQTRRVSGGSTLKG